MPAWVVLFLPKAGCSWGEVLLPLLDPYGPCYPGMLSAFRSQTAYGLPLEGEVMAFHTTLLAQELFPRGSCGSREGWPVWKPEVCPSPWQSSRVLAAIWHVWRLRQGSLGWV